MWDKARAGGEGLSEKELETLCRLGVLVPDRNAEQEEMRAIFDKVNREKRPFNALVTLTLECNLACPYCFEDPFRGSFRMSAETAQLLIQRLMERMDEGRDVTIDFYGGEALMALPLLKSIASSLAKAAPERGVKFGFTIISNGTLLTRRVVEELLPLGLESVRITIDGPSDIHDQQRPFVSGQGSFATILSNIKAVRDLLKPDVSGNYTRHNYRRFPELLDLFIAEGLTPDKLNHVFFSPVTPKADGSVSGDFSSTCASGGEPWMIEASLYLREEILRRGFNTPRLRMAGCMVEFESDVVVAYDGGIYKCPAFMGQDDMRVGTLAEGINDYRQSHNLDLWKTDECLECPYLPLCFGGCRFFRKLKTGSIDGVDCRREFYDASLERLVRQDLDLRQAK